MASNRTMNKPKSTLLGLMISLIAVTVGGCLRFNINEPSISNAPGPTSSQTRPNATAARENTSEPESKTELTIRTIDIYGWWWTDQQLESNFDADNPPPKTAYVKLEKWDASQPDSAHPDRIDIICRLENHAKEPIHISLEGFADFKVASYKAIAYGADTEQAVDEKLKQIQWSNKQTIGVSSDYKLLPGESKNIEFKNFDIRAVINKYLKPASGDLWPWRLRISMTVKNSKGVSVTQAQTTISVVPGG